MRLIVVEDERVTREGIVQLLSRAAEVEVAAVCVSAREGFEKIRQLAPDAVITDIVMDGESGLEMIEWCREAGIGCEFVLLSGYSEFSYAQNACRLGVFDYLTKPLNILKFPQLLERLQQRVEQKKRRLDMSVAYYYQRPAPPREAGGPDVVRVAAVNYFFPDRPLIAPGAEEASLWLSRALSQCNFYATQLWAGGLPCAVLTGAGARREAAEPFVRAVRGCAPQGCRVLAGFSDAWNSLAQVSGAVEQAQAAVKDCALCANAVAFSADLAYDTRRDPAPQFAGDFYRVQGSLQAPDADVVVREVSQRLDEMAALLPAYVLFAFVEKCAQSLSAAGPTQALNSAGSLDALKARFGAMVVRSLAVPVESGGTAIERAIKYVNLHYMEGVNAADIAHMFFIDPAYFSKSFKKAVGRNYNDYVTALRMERARQLLMGGHSVSDVAGMVGYRSVRHFSKRFKRHTGLFPSEVKGQNNAPE